MSKSNKRRNAKRSTTKRNIGRRNTKRNTIRRNTLRRNTGRIKVSKRRISRRRNRTAVKNTLRQKGGSASHSADWVVPHSEPVAEGIIFHTDPAPAAPAPAPASTQQRWWRRNRHAPASPTQQRWWRRNRHAPAPAPAVDPEHVRRFEEKFPKVVAYSEPRCPAIIESGETCGGITYNHAGGAVCLSCGKNYTPPGGLGGYGGIDR